MGLKDLIEHAKMFKDKKGIDVDLVKLASDYALIIEDFTQDDILNKDERIKTITGYLTAEIYRGNYNAKR